MDRLRARARLAAAHPFAGRVVPELAREDVREIVEGNYRIVYRLHTDAVEVLLVFESHRLFPEVETLHEPRDPRSGPREDKNTASIAQDRASRLRL